MGLILPLGLGLPQRLRLVRSHVVSAPFPLFPRPTSRGGFGPAVLPVAWPTHWGHQQCACPNLTAALAAGLHCALWASSCVSTQNCILHLHWDEDK